MAPHTLYAYAICRDAAVSERVSDLARLFVASRSWRCPDVWAVRNEGPDADLGINLVLPEPFSEPEGWSTDLDAIVDFCVQTRRDLSCDFTIGVADQSGTEEILEIDSDTPDLDYLKKFLGVSPPGRT